MLLEILEIAERRVFPLTISKYFLNNSLKEASFHFSFHCVSLSNLVIYQLFPNRLLKEAFCFQLVSIVFP